ncbi:HAD family hydrolase [uncultured Friedmanniella sp.]|uniref:HAD family hydrolase n=1 Tax=uncultured Friedmanniella sp. TaxID=335381 RepID=UPI0035CC194D
MASSLRAVLIDADGVLQHMTVEWRDEIGERAGSGGPHTERLLDAIARAEKPTMTGQVDLAHSLTQVLDAHDADVEVEEVLGAWQNIEVDPAMLDGVRALAGRGIILALTTNQSVPRARWMQANLPYGELFEAQFYSCEMGLAKPDPAYFHHVLDALGLQPEEALFMDDTEANVQSAAQLGIRAELFARDGGRPELDRILARHGLL